MPAPFLHGHVIPIPKGHDRDLRDPSNYRGISLLSPISKVLEKVLINIISPDITLNPLQGGFRSGYSCLHTAYILQEAIQHIREQHKKAYATFLDARKTFDTVWHEGHFIKLHNKGLPMRIWHLLHTWYTRSLPAQLPGTTPPEPVSPFVKVSDRVPSSHLFSTPSLLTSSLTSSPPQDLE